MNEPTFFSSTKRSTQEEQALALTSSFPARLKQLTTQAVVHAYSSSGPKLTAECEQHSAELANIRREAEAGIEALRVALSAADDPETFGEVFRQIQACQSDKVNLAQQFLSLCMKSLDLAQRVRDEIEPKRADFAEFLEETKTRVRGQLHDIGSGPETLPLYEKNVRAVEQQFENTILAFNSYVRCAKESLTIVLGEFEGACQQIKAKQAAIESAKQLLHGLALKAIGT